MYPRTNYEMTEADLTAILDACKPVPYMVIGGQPPRSQQENANAAWATLGTKMGFDHMTVQPRPGGNRFFTAIPSETDEQRMARLDRDLAVLKTDEIARLEAEITVRQARLAALRA